MKLNAKAFALTAGIFWGLALLILTVVSVATGGYGSQFLALISDIYPGYEVSYTGGLIGLVYGFLDGVIGCYIFAWLYNLLTDKLK